MRVLTSLGQATRVRRPQTWMTVLALLFVVLGLARSDSASALERGPRQTALLATVYVVVPDNSGRPYSGGSGTVLDAENGYILTNFHVLGDTDTGDLFNDEGMAVIGVNPANLRGAPVLKYVATMVKGDPDVDLALLQIVGLFGDDSAKLPQNLGLTEAPRGASIDLLIGDPIYVLGFPSLGGDTITYTEGAVSGFLDENGDGAEEWMKTDAEVNHGNSGGLAVNDQGQFIGVPTAGNSDPEAAGKISLIRPGDLALKYYDAWSLGQDAPVGSGAEIGKVEFGEAVRRNGAVVRPALRFDSGVTDLYAVFEYHGFGDGQQMSYTWYHDGAELDGDSFEWNGGASGTDWLSISAEGGMADGFYELEMALDGRTLYRGGVMVGEGDQRGGNIVIGDITFAEGVGDDGQPIQPAKTFSNIDEAFAIFPVQGMRNGVLMRPTWYYEGQQVLDDEAPWNAGDVDVSWVSLTHRDGLPVGDYKLEIFIDGRLAQSGEFAISEKSASISQDVSIIGTVVDADNKRRKIADALIVFLQPGVTVDDWVDADFDEAMVHASGASNRSGEYQLDGKVTAGESYSVVVMHDNFQPVTADDYQIPADASDPYIVDVTMERK